MGISVVTWTLGITDAVEVTKKAIELGLDGIQYAGDHRDVKPQDLKDEAKAAGLKIIAIDPINAGPVDPSKATEDEAINYYKQVVDFAVAAGSVPVTLHGLALWTRSCQNKNAARMPPNEAHSRAYSKQAWVFPSDEMGWKEVLSIANFL